MVKKVSIIFLLFFILCMNSNVVSASKVISVFVNGEKINFDVNPIEENGRVLVPMRKIFEKLNTEVEWDDESESVFATKEGILIQMTINSNVIYKNTIAIPTDVSPRLINDRTYIPVRAVAECLNANVEWNDNENFVIIKTETDNISCTPYGEEFTYFGEVIDGKADGYGYIIEKSTSKIISAGMYKLGEQIKGSLFFEDDSIYTGEFLKNEPSGNGKLIYPNGNYYEGYWNNGSMQGYGTYYDSAINSEFYGFFRNGLMNGKFTVIDLYTGEFVYALFSDGKYIGLENKNPNVIIHDDLPSESNIYNEGPLFVNEFKKYDDALDEQFKTSKQAFDTKIYNSSEAQKIYMKYNLDTSWILDGVLMGFDSFKWVSARTEYEKQEYEKYKEKYEYHKKYLPIANAEIKAMFGY